MIPIHKRDDKQNVKTYQPVSLLPICVKPNNSEWMWHFEQVQDTLPTGIEISNQKYYFKLSRKLAVNKINPKCYWSILKIFLSNKKILCIPSLIHNNQFFVDFKEKKWIL